jgi:hypothetical protein
MSVAVPLLLATTREIGVDTTRPVKVQFPFNELLETAPLGELQDRRQSGARH